MHQKWKRGGTALFGAVIIFAAAYGIYALFSYGISRINGERAPEAREAIRLEQYISPIVLVDVSPFENLEAANQKELLLSAIWDAILKNQDQADYPYDDSGRMILPESAVAESFEKLFGRPPAHQSVDSGQEVYEYLPQDHAYLIPLVGISENVVCRVTKLKKQGSITSVFVDYLNILDWDNNQPNYNTAKLEKKMIFVMQMENKKEKIISLKKN